MITNNIHIHFIEWVCGGSVVEHPTPEREVKGSKPTFAVLCPNTLLPTVLVIPRKRWLCPDMTEKLSTGMLKLKTNKHFYREICKIIPGLSSILLQWFHNLQVGIVL